MTNSERSKVLDTVQSISDILEGGHDAKSRIAQLIDDASDHQLATILDIYPEGRQITFKSISSDRYAQVLDIINSHTLHSIANHLTDHELAKIIDNSPSIIAKKIAGSIARSRLDRTIPYITDDKKRKSLESFVNYPRRSIGRIMQTEFITVFTSMTVKEALELVEKFDQVSNPIYQVYVSDPKTGFVGTVSIFDLLRSAKSRKLKDVLLQKPPVIRPQTSQAKVAQLFRDHDLIEAPVIVDDQVVGRVLVDDILDVVEQEFAEDLQKFAGISDDETMETSALQSSRRRLPWMILNIFMYLIAVSVIMPFQETIALVTALAVIMPIVSNVGGNVGIQSISVGIRTLSANRPNWRLARKELSKELRVGLINGLVLGIIVGTIAFIWFGNAWLGGVTLLALLINTVLGSIAGGLIPILLKKLGKDPAMMGGAVLTTITDFCGFLLFLGLARMFMHLLV